MADVITQACDECGAIKREANHWFRAYAGMGRFFIGPRDELATLMPDLPHQRYLDLCSESCAVKAMCKAIGVK